jgi:hypothetical protein
MFLVELCCSRFTLPYPGESEKDEPDDKTIFDKWVASLDVDPIKETVKLHGPIQTILKTERYYGEYKEFSRSVKAKYFRKKGLPIDVFADLANLTINDLIEKLTRM